MYLWGKWGGGLCKCVCVCVCVCGGGGMVSKLSNLAKTVGTLRSDDRDRNENVKKAVRFYNQNNNSTHASRFLVISFP